MFTLICILFTTLATNTYGLCEGASKQILNLKILLRRFGIPGSTTDNPAMSDKDKTYV